MAREPIHWILFPFHELAAGFLALDVTLALPALLGLAAFDAIVEIAKQHQAKAAA